MCLQQVLQAAVSDERIQPNGAALTEGLDLGLTASRLGTWRMPTPGPVGHFGFGGDDDPQCLSPTAVEQARLWHCTADGLLSEAIDAIPNAKRLLGSQKMGAAVTLTAIVYRRHAAAAINCPETLVVIHQAAHKSSSAFISRLIMLCRRHMM